MADKTVTVTCSEVGIASLPDELQVTLETTDEELERLSQPYIESYVSEHGEEIAQPYIEDALAAILAGRY